MDLGEYLAQASEFEGLSVPDGFMDTVATIHGDIVSSADAKVAELSAALEAAVAEVQRIKSHNYDLLMAVGETAGAEGEPETEPEDEAEPTTVEDLFE